uniref:C2H2-type domain-containing protein n=1 Tax=Plectus sambesii TaxID=2011161 RepID=A0A914WED5_9BILA
MAARAAEDAALQQTSMPTALLGVDMVAVSLANATAEVENLLRKECDVILECRFCRNLFRSIINFISHKRTHCRGLYQTVAAAASAISDVGRRSNGEKAALIELLPRRASSSGDPSDSTSVGVGSSAPFESLNEKNVSTDESSSSCHTSIFTGTHLSRKTAKARTGPSAALRRVSAVAVLSKRIETTTVELADGAAKLDLHTLPRIAKSVPTTKITNGVQEVVDMPNDLASKEPVESDRVVMVIPQDLTSSYGNMRLRNRRQAPGGDVPARSVSPAEMELVERVTKYAGGQVEVATLSCLATSCEKDKRTFSSLKCLAYHVSVWHKPLTPVNNRFICLVCGSLFARNVGLQTHLRMFHRDIYDEHHRSRSLEREDSDTRGRKTQKKKARGSDDSSANGGAADQPRSRSLSPLSNDDGVDARHQHEMKDSPLTRTRSLLIDRQSLSHLESPTRLSLSANRRSLNQRSTHRLENVLANLRRSREDAVSFS